MASWWIISCLCRTSCLCLFNMNIKTEILDSKIKKVARICNFLMLEKKSYFYIFLELRWLHYMTICGAPGITTWLWSCSPTFSQRWWDGSARMRCRWWASMTSSSSPFRCVCPPIQTRRICWAGCWPCWGEGKRSEVEVWSGNPCIIMLILRHS